MLTIRGCSPVSGVTSRPGAARVARRSKLVTLLDFRVAEVNALHPFREGNTRSQRVFFEQLARVAGWPIDWASIDYPAFIRARYENLRTARTDLLVDVLAAAVCEPS